MSQHGYTLDVGRRGATLTIFRLDKTGANEYSWSSIFNGRGIQCERTDAAGNQVLIADFESFLYPDNIEEGELDLAIMLYGSELPEDREVIRLCSLLVAKWAAGHDEESFHDVIRPTLKRWSEKTT